MMWRTRSLSPRMTRAEYIAELYRRYGEEDRAGAVADIPKPVWSRPDVGVQSCCVRSDVVVGCDDLA
jgi:hypothetical protein